MLFGGGCWVVVGLWLLVPVDPVGRLRAGSGNGLGILLRVGRLAFGVWASGRCWDIGLFTCRALVFGRFERLGV